MGKIVWERSYIRVINPSRYNTTMPFELIVTYKKLT